MARRKRFHLHSAIYHVMLRGNDGQQIFFSDADRYRMCLLIQEGVERFGHCVHSFCFMTNHIHLAIQVGTISISKIMQNLAFRYTRYMNKRQDRVGHLFQGRFKSVVVDGERYQRELIRYIHLNPVRAGLVKQPEEYLWSSHRNYLDLSEICWVTPDCFLSRFGTSHKEALVNYEQFIRNGIGIKTEMDFKRGSEKGVLGDKASIKAVLEQVEMPKKQGIELDQLVITICKHFELEEVALCDQGKERVASHARATLALLVKESENLSLEKLATFLKRDPSSLSKLARRLEERCLKEQAFAVEVMQLREKVFS